MRINTTNTHVHEQVSDWMSTLGATLWGRAFDLSQPESKELAVDFFVRYMRDFLDYVDRTEMARLSGAKDRVYSKTEFNRQQQYYEDLVNASKVNALPKPGWDVT